MKTTLAVCLSLLVCSSALAQSTSVAQNQPISRYPSISSSLYSNILYWDSVAQGYSYPRHIIVTEGTCTDRNDASLGYEEYFAVNVPGLPDGGTVLAVDPFTTSEWMILGSGTTVHDVVNHVNYYVQYNRDIYNNIVTGTFTIAGQQFSIYIYYPASSGWYPSMCLTWGNGSSPNNTGNIIDDLSQVVLDETAPTNSSVTIQLANGVAGVPDGTYIGNTTTNENYFAQSIQTSSDSIHWTTETNQTFGIIGYTYYYQFPSAVGNKFFRAKQMP